MRKVMTTVALSLGLAWTMMAPALATGTVPYGDSEADNWWGVQVQNSDDPCLYEVEGCLTEAIAEEWKLTQNSTVIATCAVEHTRNVFQGDILVQIVDLSYSGSGCQFMQSTSLHDVVTEEYCVYVGENQDIHNPAGGWWVRQQSPLALGSDGWSFGAVTGDPGYWSAEALIPTEITFDDASLNEFSSGIDLNLKQDGVFEINGGLEFQPSGGCNWPELS